MKITFKIWILIILVMLSFLSIFVNVNPFGITFLQKGVLVTNIESDSQIYQDGLRQGLIIQEINQQKINNVEDYTKAISEYLNLKENQTKKIEIKTNNLEIINIYSKQTIENIQVGKLPISKLKTGLDLQGGARAFIKPNTTISDSDTEDLMAILRERLNVYGLSDVNIYKIKQITGETLIGIEIAGSSPQELEDLIGQQGKFEAKIGNSTVFVGGNKDITHVGRTGQDAMVTECFTSEQEACNFRFTITLSEEAAQRHADITNNLSIEGQYLSQKLDFYIDGILTSSLNIGADLKGNVATSIQIEGSGEGVTREEAIDAAELEMKKLQTILITGSLSQKLNIVKIDKISPNLGEKFTRQILIAGAIAVLVVSAFAFIRYRRIKISTALVLTSMSEIIIILGVAGLIKWNLDLPSMAGIIATIGTGIDSQIIILDESRQKDNTTLAQQIKKALFIITTAFATAVVALLPLTGLLGFLGISAVSAGLLKGFAITTIIGISVGVFISRPAFADIVKQIEH